MLQGRQLVGSFRPLEDAADVTRWAHLMLQDGMTPLCMAASTGRVEVAIKLLAAGEAVDVANTVRLFALVQMLAVATRPELGMLPCLLQTS